MRRIYCVILVLCGVLWSDNFIIDSRSLKDFELLLKPNQTLIIDHQTKALLGILESLENGAMKRLPIPKEWLDKNEDHASRLRTYSDYTQTKSTIGSSTTTIYRKNHDFTPPTTSSKPAPQIVPISESRTSSTHFSSHTPKYDSPDTSAISESRTQSRAQPIKAPREWDKKKIIYEQKTEFIELDR